MKYETDRTEDANSNGGVEVEISFTESKLLFVLDEQKTKGEEITVCLVISSHSPPSDIRPEHVKIRQSYSNDGWGVKEIQIQKYPGSVEYATYAIDKEEPRFWTDGNSDCLPRNDGLLCCANGEWCDLTIVGNYYYYYYYDYDISIIDIIYIYIHVH